MLKRLVEVALPLKEVSEHSAREKSIRHGHISTLHIWWARRPLAACRAVVFAALIPDPDDPECPEEFRKLVIKVLGKGQFKPRNGDGSSVEDTPRNRCLEFIKHLVRWENSNNPDYIEPARQLIATAHKFLHPDTKGDAPKVLDPFAGGGAIPLEALRLGCEAHAVDLNPVAHLIQLCTLVYPQKYGQPDSRPVPDYIKRLIAHNRATKKAKSEQGLFDQAEAAVASDDEIIPDVEITEAEYRKNPLATDVKYWGHWVLEKARREIGQFYPSDPDGSIPVAYLWARTVTCPNPQCRATVPLIRQFWLCRKATRNVVLQLRKNRQSQSCQFDIIEEKSFEFDPNEGTMKLGKASCPFCETVIDGDVLRQESKAGRMGQQLMAVVATRPKAEGKIYRAACVGDEETYRDAAKQFKELIRVHGETVFPTEPITPDRPSPNSRGLSAVVRYGLARFGDLFNQRQLLTLLTFCRLVKELPIASVTDTEYSAVVQSYLALGVSRLSDYMSTLCIFNNVGGRGVVHTFGRQALQMVWDYPESSPFNGAGGKLASRNRRSSRRHHEELLARFCLSCPRVCR